MLLFHIGDNISVFFIDFCCAYICILLLQDEIEDLRLRAQDLIIAKAQLEKDLIKAKKEYSDDVYLISIEQVLKEVFHPQSENDSDLGRIGCAVQQKENPSATNDNVCKVANEFELRPEDIAHLEIVEYLNSRQARLDMPDLFGEEEEMHDQEEKRDDVPSFSLGIEDKTNNEKEDFITPRPATRKKSTRIVKLGKYAKSPYIERVIDITGKYTNQDLAIYIYMIQKNDLL